MKKVQNKSDFTEIVFVLDRSGSMVDVVSDTIGGFNSMIKRQKEEVSNAFVTTVLFDDKINIIHDRIKINEVPLLTNKEYYARGCTALLDAIGCTIKHIRNIHKYARKSDIPAKTLFIITTDGYENSSHEYSMTKVKSMIEEQKTKNNWDFLFLGANIDAIESANKIGIDREYAANVINDKEGVDVLYQTVSDAVYRCSKSCCLSKNWKEKIDNDFKRRNKSNKNTGDKAIPSFLRK